MPALPGGGCRLTELSDWKIRADEWPAAVADTDGPQLVVAGPGTGKTEFLVQRAVRLVSTGRATIDQLLVLTFSRRAAADLKRRIIDGLDRSLTTVEATTFHSFGYRLLEAYAPDHLSWSGMPSLLTGPEQVALVLEVMADEDPSDWPVTLRGLLHSPTLAADVADFGLRTGERMIDIAALAGLAADRPEWRALPAFFQRYRQELARRGRIDYGGILETARVLLDIPEVRAATGRQYTHILVDEYQDTSPVQATLLEQLSRAHRNLTVVGDPYQSVYSFRGAELDNIARFPAQFPDRTGRPARRLILGESRRVPEEILTAAVRLTAGGALPGSAGPVTPAPHGGKVDVYLFDQESAEAEWIAEEVERMSLEDSIPYNQMAVLVRSKRRLLPELSRALERRRVPHDRPDSRLVDHPAVRAVLDVVQATVHAAAAAVQPRSGVVDELDRAMRRIMLGPLLGLSLGAERALIRERLKTRRPWGDILASKVPGTEALARLISDPGWAIDRPAIDGFWVLWEAIPQFEPLVRSPERGDFRAAWASLSQALERQAERDRSVSLARFLQMAEEDDFEASPLLGFTPDSNRVVLTTLHQVKGLEFEVVFIADAVEGVFPDLRRGVSLLHPEALVPERADRLVFRRFRLQEEMRLGYTAMTRAHRRVVWTATTAGIDEADRRPSRFLPVVAGVGGIDEIAPPPTSSTPPTTSRELEARLRQTLVDPAQHAVDRLAAAAVLTGPTGPALWPAAGFAGLREPGPSVGVMPTGFLLSPSQAESYDLCPRRYVFERRIRVEDITSSAMQFGSLCHLLLEMIERRTLAEGHRPNLDEARAVIEQVWQDAEFGSETLNQAYRNKAELLLEKLWTRWPADSNEPVALEHPMQLELGGVSWVGRADRIERTHAGTLRVVDYKTGKTQVSLEDGAKSLQLGFYLLAALADPGILAVGKPAEAQLWYPLAVANKFWRDFDPKRLDEVRTRLGQIAGDIGEEDWSAKPGVHCRHCPVRNSCPAWPEGREAYGL